MTNANHSRFQMRFYQVRVTHRVPSARRADKDSALMIDDNKGTEHGVHSASMKTLAMSEAYQKITSARLQNAKWLDGLSTDSGQPGLRLVPEQLLPQVVQGLEERQQEFMRLAAEFRNALPLIADALECKGVKIDRDPDAYFFALEFTVLPPNGTDVSAVPATYQELVRQGIEATEREAELAMKRDLSERLREPLTRLADALAGGPGKKLHNSTRDALANAASQVATIADDPKLRALAMEIQSWHDEAPGTETMRDAPAMRSQEAERLRKLTEKALFYQSAI